MCGVRRRSDGEKAYISTGGGRKRQGETGSCCHSPPTHDPALFPPSTYSSGTTVLYTQCPSFFLLLKIYIFRFVCMCLCEHVCVSAAIGNCEDMKTRTGCGAPQRRVPDICDMTAGIWPLVLMTGHSDRHLFSCSLSLFF